MIGLDSNVLVRYLTQDDPVQSRPQRRKIGRRLTARPRPTSAAIVEEAANQRVSLLLAYLLRQRRRADDVAR